MARRPQPAWPRRLARFLDADGRDREVVHDLHRDLRRSRFEGQIIGRVLGAPRADRSLERPSELRDLERALGRWRDAEMTRDLWHEVRTVPTPAAEARWLAARDRALAREARGHERTAVELARRLLADAAVPAEPRAPARGLRPLDAPSAWRKELAARRGRYLKSFRRLGRALPAEAAHAFRQELRRLGVFYDLLAATPWAAPPRRPAKVQRVLDRLGRVHDLDRAIGRLAHEAPGPLRDEFRHRLKAERRRAATRAQRTLAAKAVRRYAEGSVRRRA